MNLDNQMQNLKRQLQADPENAEIRQKIKQLEEKTLNLSAPPCISCGSREHMSKDTYANFSSSSAEYETVAYVCEICECYSFKRKKIERPRTATSAHFSESSGIFQINGGPFQIGDTIGFDGQAIGVVENVIPGQSEPINVIPPISTPIYAGGEVVPATPNTLGDIDINADNTNINADDINISADNLHINSTELEFIVSGHSIEFSEFGERSLAGFTSYSVIGAINELKRSLEHLSNEVDNLNNRLNFLEDNTK